MQNCAATLRSVEHTLRTLPCQVRRDSNSGEPKFKYLHRVPMRSRNRFPASTLHCVPARLRNTASAAVIPLSEHSSHPALWRNFAAALGVDDDSLDSAETRSATVQPRTSANRESFGHRGRRFPRSIRHKNEGLTRRARANSTWFRPCVRRNSRSRSANRIAGGYPTGCRSVKVKHFWPLADRGAVWPPEKRIDS